MVIIVLTQGLKKQSFEAPTEPKARGSNPLRRATSKQGFLVLLFLYKKAMTFLPAFPYQVKYLLHKSFTWVFLFLWVRCFCYVYEKGFERVGIGNLQLVFFTIVADKQLIIVCHPGVIVNEVYGAQSLTAIYI
ncbi:MAG: hypothetical protein IKB67_04585 [Clostridia bacterium]|nr:hypothetical protein [Clostridia bacterium]